MTMELVLAALAGGVVTKLIDWLLNRGERTLSMTAQMQELWVKEQERLHHEVNRLHVLVGVLEEEIVRLGGDPERVARTVQERMSAIPPA